MKGILLAALFCLIPCSMSSEGTNVYISMGKCAYAYHRSSNCYTIKKKSNVRSVSLEQALKMKRTPCKVCYGK